MNEKVISIACNERLMEKIRDLLGSFGIGIDVLMSLYRDVDKYKDDYKYGRMDTATAYGALYRLMQAKEELTRVESMLADVGDMLKCMSDGLYRQKDNGSEENSLL